MRRWQRSEDMACSILTHRVGLCVGLWFESRLIFEMKRLESGSNQGPLFPGAVARKFYWMYLQVCKNRAIFKMTCSRKHRQIYYANV